MLKCKKINTLGVYNGSFKTYQGEIDTYTRKWLQKVRKDKAKFETYTLYSGVGDVEQKYDLRRSFFLRNFIGGGIAFLIFIKEAI